MAAFIKRLFAVYIIFSFVTNTLWLVQGQSDESINRLNFGVMFKHMGRLSVVTDIWEHTYAVKLPSNENLGMDPRIPRAHLNNITRTILMNYCPTNDGGFAAHRLGCNLWSGNVKFLDKIYTDGHERLGELLQAIHSLIPNYKPGNNKRITKSLLPVVGSIARSLFNLATLDDVKTLQSHILQMAKLQDDQTKVLQKASEHMSSFVSTSIARIDGLADTMRASIKLVRTIEADALQHLKFLNNISLYTEEIIHAINDLEQQYANTLSAMEILIGGRLPSFLIPISVLSNTLQQVSAYLQESEASMQILHEPSWLYAHGSFVYAVSNGTLYIKIKIPLSSIPTHMFFDAYKVEKYPSVLHDQSAHVTMLQGAPEGIAVDSSQELYYTMTKEDLSNIALQHYGEKVPIFNKVTGGSCIMAIF